MKYLKTYESLALDMSKFSFKRSEKHESYHPSKFPNAEVYQYYLTYDGKNVGDVIFTFDQDVFNHSTDYYHDSDRNRFQHDLQIGEAFLISISLINQYQGYNIGIKLLKDIMNENNIRRFYLWGGTNHKVWNKHAERLQYKNHTYNSIFIFKNESIKKYNEAVGEMKLTCGIYLFDVNNKLLIQHPTNFRATVWGIPKGRFDADETDVFDVCKRELFEETGITLDDYNIVHKEELDIAQYNDTNKFLKSYFVKVDSDLSDVKLHCDSMVMRDGKPAFPEVDDWKWVDIDEADRIFSADRMSSFQENNIKRCKLILSKI